jgi:Xaa-Pro dipeptidase
MTERADIVRSRVIALQDLLRERRASALWLDTRHDFAWLTLGGQNHVLYTSETGVAPLLITPDDAVVLAPINEHDRIAAEEIAGLPLRIQSRPWPESPAAPDSALTATDIADELESLRTALVPEEHERMGWIAGTVQEVCSSVLAPVDPGRTTEDDLIADATAAFLRRGVRLPVILVAADDRIDRFRHPISAGKTIHRRVMLIVCAERWGLIVAHTQFAEFAALTPDQLRAADGTAHVLAAMRAATVPGNTLGDVLGAARTAYADHGVPDEWTLHHQGGTTGYRARERIAKPTDVTPIRPGMAFAWNPSITGFKREETLYLDSAGERHVLTTIP